MKILKYRIIETPDEKFCLLGISSQEEQQLIYMGTKDRCCKLLKDIEHGHRDALGCKLLLEHEVELKDILDIN